MFILTCWSIYHKSGTCPIPTKPPEIKLGLPGFIPYLSSPRLHVSGGKAELAPFGPRPSLAASLLCLQCLALRGAERQKLMRAERHRQHILLHRALQTWGVGAVAFLQIALPLLGGGGAGFWRLFLLFFVPFSEQSSFTSFRASTLDGVLQPQG